MIVWLRQALFSQKVYQNSIRIPKKNRKSIGNNRKVIRCEIPYSATSSRAISYVLSRIILPLATVTTVSE